MTEASRDPRAAVEALGRARRVLVTAHTSPDGDAVGSALGLAELARALGARAEVVLRDQVPANLQFLPGYADVRVTSSVAGEAASAYDLVAVLECPGLDRPGLEGLDRWPLLNVDHHLGNAVYGVVNYVDDEAPAVGEMVLRMADAAGVAITPSMATNLYTALVTDTGDFRYSSVTPRAFAAAGRLVTAGAVPHAIAEELWDHTPERIVRLQAAVLSTLEMHAGGQVAVITLDRATLDACGAQPEDTENLVNIPRSIAGVRVAVFLKALTPAAVKVSLRSRGAIDVQAVARRFGGGGHAAAAGCTVAGTLAEVRATVLGTLFELLEQR